MSDGRKNLLRMEVVYALPDQQVLTLLEVEEGASVREAIESSGILRQFPEIELVPGRVGIFGNPVDPDSLLRDGDRVEIYRSLEADPKETRRRRVKRSR